MEAGVPCLRLGHVPNLDCARERFLGRKDRLVDRVHAVRSTRARAMKNRYTEMGGRRRKVEALEWLERLRPAAQVT